MEFRIGNGFDVHKLINGDSIILCGVKIPHDKTLSGHSDADVGYHSICDALYGALSEGDIGTHFPATSKKWKDADSIIFLKHAYSLVNNLEYKIMNIDTTFICERPKISDYCTQMKVNIAEILKIDLSRVSIKATTTERLGFCGREEGIACLTTVGLFRNE